MIEARMDVDVGGSVVRVVAQTESILRVLELADARYSGAGTSVIFPIEPEDFFVGEAFSEEFIGLPVPMAVTA